MTKLLKQEEAVKYFEDISITDSYLEATSRLLIKTGITVDCVIESLIKVATKLSYYHHKGDYEDFILKCSEMHVKRLQKEK